MAKETTVVWETTNAMGWRQRRRAAGARAPPHRQNEGAGGVTRHLADFGDDPKQPLYELYGQGEEIRENMATVAAGGKEEVRDG